MNTYNQSYQADQEFKVILSYTVSSGITWATCSKETLSLVFGFSKCFSLIFEIIIILYTFTFYIYLHYFSLPFPLSKPFHILLLAIFQIHGFCFSINAVTCFCKCGCVFLHYSVCIMLLLFCFFVFFRTDRLLLSDQLVCSSLRKLVTVS